MFDRAISNKLGGSVSKMWVLVQLKMEDRHLLLLLALPPEAETVRPRIFPDRVYGFGSLFIIFVFGLLE